VSSAARREVVWMLAVLDVLCLFEGCQHDSCSCWLATVSKAYFVRLRICRRGALFVRHGVSIAMMRGLLDQ
jgi:hypothetical protein